MSRLIPALRANIQDPTAGDLIDAIAAELRAEIQLARSSSEARESALRTSLAELRQEITDLRALLLMEIEDDARDLTRAKIVRLMRHAGIYDDG